ncbi:MAG: PilZ domain-containing protein [Terriglobales bacterium]
MGEPKNKSRRWQRLAIAFPIFVHGTDSEGRSILEFGTALNVSAGGVLVAVKRVPSHKDVIIEMPVPPGFVSQGPTSHRMIEGRIVRSQAGARHTYLGLEFKRPLLPRERSF